MCLEMANVIQNHEGLPENLRQQLAVAVRSIQWSYAIFWSLSKTQHGVLEWVDGYYNGDIKTRKTVQAMELKADKIGLQRSEQLRELFESLSEGESEQQAKRPSAALSPEDLSDAEWYYLVCMSFVFNPGQGLPGRALANGETIWLCDAPYADSKVFSRSLLAKSASIQTVVCFPHLGGVIELGVTELVPEDANLLQRVKASLLELSKPVCSDKSSSIPLNTDDDKDPMCAKVDHDVVDTLSLENLYSPAEDIKFDEEGINALHDNINEEFTMDSPDECSNGCEHNHQTEDSFMLEGVNGAASQVQSWHFMDDEFSNGAQDSMNSSDCISEAFANQEKALCSSNCENENNLKELQEGNHSKLSSLDLGAGDDLFYRRTISAILRSSCRLIENPYFRSSECKTSFTSWKKGRILGYRPRGSQKMLKKILCSIPLMHGSLKPGKENDPKGWIGKSENYDACHEHVFPDKTRENEKFLVLRSMVPSVSEIDKSSILSDTIKYLKELEARVEELESCMDSAELEAEARRKYADIVEQTSDNNHDTKKIGGTKKVWLNKRKACDVIDENEPEQNRIVSKEGSSLYVRVSVKEHEVQIEMRCAFREYILLDIMDAINNLHLDAHCVQSSTDLDGVLTVNLKSKFRGTAVAPVGMIKQALCKVTGRC